MPKKSQFQNLVLQQILQEQIQQPTLVQPSITLPIEQEALVPLPPALSFFSSSLAMQTGTEIAEKRSGELLPFPANTREEMNTPPLSGLLLPSRTSPSLRRKKLILRGTAIFLSTLLALAIFLTWRSTTPTAASPMITQQAYGNLASTPAPHLVNDPTVPPNGNAATIQVYIVGAVKHPGVYTLSNGARVYQLIQAAGGTQTNADLVSLNLAARLSDGQEIYVLSVGEAPPAYTGAPGGVGTTSTPGSSSGAPVNLNTADETTMEKTLHISAATARKIIDYRTQHGAYTTVDQLALVVSKTIYNRIKGMVTV